MHQKKIFYSQVIFDSFFLSFHHVEFIKLEFVALDITGKNYLSWILDAEMHLDAKDLGDTIKQGNKTSNQDKAKAMIFLRHHLHEGLKIEYLTVKDPLELWININNRYDHLKLTVLPKARYEWIYLRFQDFKSVTEYNSTIHKVSSILKLCGDTITDDDLFEKALSTFHASNVLLQQQYREKGFRKYSELITCLLVVEQNNTLLMRIMKPIPMGPLHSLTRMLQQGLISLKQDKIITMDMVEDAREGVVADDIIIIIMMKINVRIIEFFKIILPREESIFVIDMA